MSDPEVIALASGGTVVELAPARGAIVTRFDVGPRSVLYLDRETLRDPTKNVRGGVPVLFPSPGKLADDQWAYGGHRGALKQHGFARNLPWTVSLQTAQRTRLELAASDATRANFPWDFHAALDISVSEAMLRIDQRVTNRGTTAMPFGFGFHPYFAVADRDKAKVSIETAARTAFDNVTKQTTAVGADIDLTRREVDLHLLDHGSSESALRLPGGEVRIRCSPEYTHWVVWTLAGKDFVCLEPWTCPGNALNSGERVLTVAPGETRALSTEITAS